MVAREVEDLVRRIGVTPGCVVHAAAGLPTVPAGLELPGDLADFYQLCGGADLFADTDYSIAVAAPDQFASSNLAVLGETGFDDRTDHWFTVGITPDHEYISIDLAPARLGRCYDSYHETHGMVGDCPIIATSFLDLGNRLLANRGQRWYWLRDEFSGLGDAYDD